MTAPTFQEDHRMGMYAWFWVVCALMSVQIGLSLLRPSLVVRGSWVVFAMPLIFALAFGPAGYRIHVGANGLRITGLGIMRMHQAFYAWIWRRASATAKDIDSVEIVRQRGLLRFINWPLIFPGKRSRQHFAFGTAAVVRVHRRDRKPLTLGTRQPEELKAALEMLD